MRSFDFAQNRLSHDFARRAGTLALHRSIKGWPPSMSLPISRHDLMTTYRIHLWHPTSCDGIQTGALRAWLSSPKYAGQPRFAADMTFRGAGGPRDNVNGEVRNSNVEIRDNLKWSKFRISNGAKAGVCVSVIEPFEFGPLFRDLKFVLRAFLEASDFRAGWQRQGAPPCRWLTVIAASLPLA